MQSRTHTCGELRKANAATAIRQEFGNNPELYEMVQNDIGDSIFSLLISFIASSFVLHSITVVLLFFVS